MNYNRLRELPAVDRLLSDDLIDTYGRTSTVDAIRNILDDTRRKLLAGEDAPTDTETLLALATQHLQQAAQPSLRRVINATGVIIHTNLGRAPLSEAAMQAVSEIGGGYSTLEFDIDEGRRGKRNAHVEGLLCAVAGAEAALVVNNCASALVLVLSALAQGREAILSRGQSVEIGGGFRIPEIMVQSGVRLVEVGTTNRTRIADYTRAVSEETALFLRVHSSNFQQIGFVESASVNELAEAAQANGLLFVDDIGSGALLDTTPFGLSPEPTVGESIAAGVDLVLFSGDKLLGGPQAGIIVGKVDAIDRLKTHPLARALRADKLCLAALGATLEHYRRNEVMEKVPVWWMIDRKLCDLGRTAKTWQKQLPHASIQKGVSTVGGGSLPGSTLPTVLLALDVPHPDALSKRLREHDIIARIAAGRVLLDPRTVFPSQEARLLEVLHTTLGEHDSA